MPVLNLYNNRFKIITALPNIIGNIPTLSVLDKSTGITYKLTTPYSSDNIDSINKEIFDIVSLTRKNKLKYFNREI